MTRFGRILRELRIAAGLSQEALAERASMSVNGISALERGSNRTPQRETLALLVRALELSPEQAEALTHAAARPSLPRNDTPRHTEQAMLPRASAPLFGREDDVKAVLQLLRSNALVTLTGPGGIGKTRLAVEAGEEAASAFRDGARFVDLAPLCDPDSVAGIVAKQFEIAEVRDELFLETIVKALRNKHALLILDNCEHLLAAAAAVADALLQRCRDLRILATSRQSLNVPGEYVYRVASLDVRAAVELFTERARHSGASFSVMGDDYDAIGRIVDRLDRIALAIELAAARMNVLTLDQLEARLSKRFQILKGGSGALQPRQQTMRTAIDWSYDLLDEDEKVFFRRLSAFSSGFTLEAAISVVQEDDDDDSTTVDLLSALVDKSLVVSDGVPAAHRFRLLETIRAYAKDQVAEHGETAALRRRHADYFARVAEAADELFGSSGSTNAWIASLEPELENFRTALEWTLLPDGDAHLAVTIVSKLQEFWITLGFAKDVSRRARAMLDGYLNLSDGERALLWSTIARMRQELFAHPAEMLEAARQARSLYERIEDRNGLALALRQSGTALMRLGEFENAEAELRRSIHLYRDAGNQRMAARGLGYLASLLQMRGDHEQARTALLEVLETARALGDDRMVPTTSMNLAETAFALGDAEGAARVAADNLANETLRKNPVMLATQAANLAVYLFALRRREEAREAALTSLRAGSGSFAAVPLQHFAAIISPEDPKRAARLLGYVDAVFRSTVFSRQYTERYTYDALLTTLYELLDERALAEYLREGESMSEADAIRLAGLSPAVAGAQT